MLNLDTEDWNEIFIGCAGGGDSVLSFPIQTEGLSGCLKPISLSITGTYASSSQLAFQPFNFEEPLIYFLHRFLPSDSQIADLDYMDLPLEDIHAGLLGGHSGLNIAEGRGNAVKMAAEILYAIFAVCPGARLAHLTAGDKRNALPREATAIIYVRLVSAGSGALTRLNYVSRCKSHVLSSAQRKYMQAILCLRQACKCSQLKNWIVR